MKLLSSGLSIPVEECYLPIDENISKLLESPIDRYKVIPELTFTRPIEEYLKTLSTRSKSVKVVNSSEFLQTHELNDDTMKKYFSMMQERYEIKVDNLELELKRWCAGIRALERRWPNRNDYESKRKEIVQMFNKKFEGYPVDSYFEHGADDTADAGAFLIALSDQESTEKLIDGVVLLSKLQWLIRKRDEFPNVIDDNTSETTTAETPTESVEDALKILFTKHIDYKRKGRNIHVNDKKWNKTRILIGTMHVLLTNGVIKSTCVKEFASLIAESLGDTSENLRKRIGEMNQEIKRYGCNLKDLNEDYIKNHKMDDEISVSRNQFIDYWEGIYEYIDSIIQENDDLKKLRG